MADKPFIAARLRNPAENAAPKAAKAPSKVDWIGAPCAIIALILAVATTFVLFQEYDILTKYIGQ